MKWLNLCSQRSSLGLKVIVSENIHVPNKLFICTIYFIFNKHCVLYICIYVLTSVVITIILTMGKVIDNH